MAGRARTVGKLAGVSALTIGALIAVPFAAFFLLGPERVLTRLSGSPDQGAVDIATLSRRATATDSLACTPGLCAARADIALPVYQETADALMRRLDAVVLSDRRNLSRVDDRSRPGYRRYVARTRIMRYPDTIDAMAVAVPGGTGLALYGRSKIGSDDWGVNRGRIEDWVHRLGLPTPDPLAVVGVPTS